jgi:hypothetical protein
MKFVIYCNWKWGLHCGTGHRTNCTRHQYITLIIDASVKVMFQLRTHRLLGIYKFDVLKLNLWKSHEETLWVLPQYNIYVISRNVLSLNASA